MFDLFYTGVKPNLFPHERNVSSFDEAKQLSRTKFFWFIEQHGHSSDLRDFNFMWVPHVWEDHHTHVFPVYSQFEQLEVRFAPKTSAGLIENYHDKQYCQRRTLSENWKILKTEAEWDIDPNWSPNPFEEPYIYVFGNPWYSSVEMPTVEYHVPGATEYKYCDEPVVTIKRDESNWKILKNVEVNKDPNWIPNPFEPAYIYVFSFQSEWYPESNYPIAEYHVPGATEYKYVDEPVVTVVCDNAHWKMLKDVDVAKDPKWCPNPFEDPYIYVFRMFSKWYPDSVHPIAEYHVPGATEYKYVDRHVLSVVRDENCWKSLRDVAISKDPTWHPDPFDPPFIYVFNFHNEYYPDSTFPIAEYHAPGGTEYKYVNENVVTVTANQSLWKTIKTQFSWTFDTNWVPNPFEEPFIYSFKNKWFADDEVVAEYHVPGATEYKYVDDKACHIVADSKLWHLLKPGKWKIDPDWAPNPFDPPYIYVFGNPWYSAVEMPTAEYRVPGATEFKYCDDKVLTIAVDESCWKILKPLAEWELDKTWAPNPFEPPYIYVFGNPWYSSVEMPTVEYHVPGATEYKYCDDQILKVKIDNSCWKILKTEVDWIVDTSWMPNPFEPAYIYVFGNPWYSSVEMPTIEYHVKGATEYKYVDEQVVKVKADPKKWKFLKSECEWVPPNNWAPNPFEPAYIYVFGNPWYSSVEMPTAEYRIAGASEYKYVTDTIVTVKPNTIKDNWKILKTEAQWNIDPTWMPNPFEEPYIYVFGNKWYSAVEMPTAEYTVPGATERKYCDEKILTVKLNHRNWKTYFDNVDISSIMDWTPDPFEPPYNYVFGNQWYPAEVMPTAEYRVPGATERKYITDEVATLTQTRLNWFVPEEINAGMIDFSWVPHPKEQPYIYHFSSEFQMSTGMTYTVPGASELKFETEVPVLTRRIGARLNAFNNVDEPKDTKSIIQTVSMFFVDMNNKMSAMRYESLKLRYPDIQKIRFMNGWVETIKRCLARTETQKFWVISSENVYDDFNFEWHAQPWQNFMTHVFASQWQKWSDTFLINKREFERHVKWAKTIEEFPNLNFVKDQPVYRPDDLYDIYYVDHLNPDSPANLEVIRKKYSDIKVSRYVDNYLATFKRVMTTADTEYVWIINSICDYSKFDFTWQPEPWQAKMLHVFPSGNQKFGDTFYVHVESFKAQMEDLEILDWFETVNYCKDQPVLRTPMETVVVTDDVLADVVKNHQFTGPYALFRTPETKIPTGIFTPSIWRKKDRAIHVLSRGGNAVLVPRDAKTEITDQLYDYPYIVDHESSYIPTKDLDIVYISNGEPDAEKWYFHLLNAAPDQRVHWIQDVKGRANAYKAAADVSSTPWFFATFAKLEVNPAFDWKWQPDRLQQPKHYMFNAKNPVNGLEYGHMGIIAYNKQLTLATNEHGLDFTLSQMHESVDMLSGTAHYNVDPIITWRTAFRESIKLRNATDKLSSVRLSTWLTVAEGENAEWSINGAKDAVEYWETVNGDMSKLLLSFEWDWLDAYYTNKYQR